MTNCTKVCLRALRPGLCASRQIIRPSGSGMSGRLLGVAALAILLGSGLAQAQKFAIIDMQKAVLATTDGKKASQAINDKFAPVKAQIEQLAKDITAKQEQFTKNRATLSPAAASAAQTEIESLATSLKRKQDDAQQDLEAEESKQLGSIVPKLQQVINEYAAANQIMFVLDSSANPNNLIYGDGSLNIISPVVLAYEKLSAGPAAAAPKAAPAATTPKAPASTTPATGAPKPPIK
jgi:outer membrane protein